MCEACDRSDTLKLAGDLTDTPLAFRRPMTAIEEAYGDVPRVAHDFDAAEEAVAKAGGKVAKRILAQLVEEANALVGAKDPAGLANIAPSYVGELTTALKSGIAKAVDLGRAQVKDAMRQQQGGRYAEPPAKNPKKALGYLAGRAAIGSKQVSEQIAASVRRAALDAIVRGEDELTDQALEALESGVLRTLVGAALEMGREALGVGRLLEAEDVKSEIAEAYYTAILDDRVCDTCAAADGTAWIADEGDDMDEAITATPNDDCEGTAARCRCYCVYIFTR